MLITIKRTLIDIQVCYYFLLTFVEMKEENIIVLCNLIKNRQYNQIISGESHLGRQLN